VACTRSQCPRVKRYPFRGLQGSYISVISGGTGGMESLSGEIIRHPIEVPCPSCSYPVWVVWAEIAAGVSVICPCCRVQIRLVDQTGSVQVAPNQVREALQKL
jgi:hypothetical protein